MIFRRKHRKPTFAESLRPQVKVKKLNHLALVLVGAVVVTVMAALIYGINRPSPASKILASSPTQYYPESEPFSLDDEAWKALRKLEAEAAAAEAQEIPRPSLKSAQRPTGQPAVVRTQQRGPTREDLERARQAGVSLGSFDPKGSPQSRVADDGLDAATRRALAALEETPETVEHRVSPRSTDQNRAADFLRRAAERRQSPSLEIVRTAARPWTVQEGTVIPATLVAGVHSDLPGQVTALVRQDVYDTTTGRHRLIPRGSRLVGIYDNRVAWGQKRVLVAWNRLVFPNGESIELQGMPSADAAGMSGLHDRVHNRWGSAVGNALMLSMVSAGLQLSQPESTNVTSSAREIAAGAVGQELGRTANELIRRQLDRQPSLSVRAGYTLNVVVTADIVLPGPYRTV